VIYKLIDNATDAVITEVEYSVGELPRAGDTVHYAGVVRAVVSVLFVVGRSETWSGGKRPPMQDSPLVYVQ
jgi:hypothetical protein